MCPRSCSRAGSGPPPSTPGSPCHPILRQRRGPSPTSARASAPPSPVRNLARSSRSWRSCTRCSRSSKCRRHTCSSAIPTGGPIIHSFAATYPKEIAGLVYVDPTDFTQTEADILALWEKAGAKDGRDGLRKMQEQMMASAPAGVKAEFRELDRMERGGFAELRAAGDPPDVPVVFLVAGKPSPAADGHLPWRLRPIFSGEPRTAARSFFEAGAARLEGTLVHTSKSGHFIHATEPELVVWAIQRVLSSAATHPELERFVGEYVLAPTFSIDDHARWRQDFRAGDRPAGVSAARRVGDEVLAEARQRAG